MTTAVVRQVDLASQIPATDFKASSSIFNESVHTLVSSASSAYGILLGSVVKKQLYVIEALPLNKGDGQLPTSSQLVEELLHQVKSVTPICVGGLYPVGFFIVGEKDIAAELPLASLVHTLYTSVNEAFPMDLRPLQSDVLVVQSYNKMKVDIDVFRTETNGSNASSLSFSRFPMTFTKRGMWGELIPVSTVITLPVSMVSPLPLSSPENQQKILQDRRQNIHNEAVKQLSLTRVNVAHVNMHPRPGMAIWGVEQEKESKKPAKDGKYITLELRAFIHSSCSITVAVRALMQDLYNTTHTLMKMNHDSNDISSWTRAWISLANNDAVTLGAFVGQKSLALTDAPSSSEETMTTETLENDEQEGVEEEGQVRERSTVSRRGNSKKLDRFSSPTTVTTALISKTSQPIYLSFLTVEDMESTAKALMTTAAAITVDAGVSTRTSRYCGVHGNFKAASQLQNEWKEKRSVDNSDMVDTAIRRRNSICNKLCGDVNTAMTIAALAGFVFSHFIAQFIEIKTPEQ